MLQWPRLESIMNPPADTINPTKIQTADAHSSQTVVLILFRVILKTDKYKHNLSCTSAGRLTERIRRQMQKRSQRQDRKQETEKVTARDAAAAARKAGVSSDFRLAYVAARKRQQRVMKASCTTAAPTLNNLAHLFNLLPSGSRYNLPKCMSNRLERARACCPASCSPLTRGSANAAATPFPSARRRLGRALPRAMSHHFKTLIFDRTVMTGSMWTRKL